MKLGIIILAAGQGKRMKSSKPKVLHDVAGYPMVRYVLDTSLSLSPDKIILVVGNGHEQVINAIPEDICEFVIQKKQLGTGHAVLVAEEKLKDIDKILVLYGDVPLIKTETLTRFISYSEDYSAVVLSMKLENPANYGRLIVKGGELLSIVEERDASFDEKKIDLVNTGIIYSDKDILYKALHLLTPENDQSEYYLTDIISILKDMGKKTTYYTADDPVEFLGINDRKALSEISMIIRKRIMNNFMLKGVSIISPENTVIDRGVKIGSGTIIHPFTYLTGSTVVGEKCTIGPYVELVDKCVDDGAIIK